MATGKQEKTQGVEMEMAMALEQMVFPGSWHQRKKLNQKCRPSLQESRPLQVAVWLGAQETHPERLAQLWTVEGSFAVLFCFGKCNQDKNCLSFPS